MPVGTAAQSSRCVSVLYSPGMCGEKFIDRMCLRTLAAGGCRVTTNYWTKFFNPFRNLRNRAQHQRGADALAKLVNDTRRERPDDAIVLLGHSTGCLVTLEALERLEQPVDQAVLLAGAVRPDYDLRRALQSARRVVNLYSPLDLIFLWAGTSLCGTADGCYRPSAGQRGFTGAGHDDPRLLQVRYDTRWRKLLHLGGHIGCFQPRFVRTVLLPIVLDKG